MHKRLLLQLEKAGGDWALSVASAKINLPVLVGEGKNMPDWLGKRFPKIPQALQKSEIQSYPTCT